MTILEYCKEHPNEEIVIEDIVVRHRTFNAFRRFRWDSKESKLWTQNWTTIQRAIACRFDYPHSINGFWFNDPAEGEPVHEYDIVSKEELTLLLL